MTDSQASVPQGKQAAPPASNALAKIQPAALVSEVMTKIAGFQQAGTLKLPPNYSAENAMRWAMLILADLKDSNSKLIIDTVTRESIANTLQEMVMKGLNPAKHQCAFVRYENRLTLQEQYQGNVAMARREGVKRVSAVAIYLKDEFETAVNNGVTVIIKHKQTLANIKEEELVGAYAVVTFDDGFQQTEVMTMAQIRMAWKQGAARGESPAHKNFPSEMSKKTVINRALKLINASSDDESLEMQTEPITPPHRPQVEVKEFHPYQEQVKEKGHDAGPQTTTVTIEGKQTPEERALVTEEPPKAEEKKTPPF